MSNGPPDSSHAPDPAPSTRRPTWPWPDPWSRSWRSTPRGVNYWYGEGEARTQVLFDNALEIGRGEVVIMTGPSGSGKTTLLTLIGALRRMQQGRLDGPRPRRRRARRARAGRAPQEHRLHLPEPQPVQLADRHGERPDGDRPPGRHGRGDERAQRPAARAARAGRPPRSPAVAALRRPASAGGDRPGPGQLPGAGAGRRADRRARRRIGPDRPRRCSGSWPTAWSAPPS